MPVALSPRNAPISSGSDAIGPSEPVSGFTSDGGLSETDVPHGALADALSRLAAAQAEIRDLQAEVHRMRELLQIDSLTGALNRHGLHEAFRRETARAELNGWPLAIAALDLDHFKRLNDTCGHDHGDTTLRLLAGTARARLRHADVVARIGGDEFIVLLPDTDARRARLVIESLQAAFAELAPRAAAAGGSVSSSFSAGITCWKPGEEFAAVYARADRALLRAKALGRRRVEHTSHKVEADGRSTRNDGSA